MVRDWVQVIPSFWRFGADAEAHLAASFGAEVGQTDFTKRFQFGAEVVFTDAGQRVFFVQEVDATECAKRVAIVASVRG
jgi:hypothetical protein